MIFTERRGENIDVNQFTDGKSFWLYFLNVLFVPVLRMSIMFMIAMDSCCIRVAFWNGLL